MKYLNSSFSVAMPGKADYWPEDWTADRTTSSENRGVQDHVAPERREAEYWTCEECGDRFFGFAEEPLVCACCLNFEPSHEDCPICHPEKL